ncbi:MAG TPA: hypothetical protein PKK07_01840 [bacterium]|nr:hypothetical protein [bacterium]
MDNLISIDNLIESAKKKGIDFGRGDPYNRLRYYTKIGWLPHMVRKTDDRGNIKGHYPDWALSYLIMIEKLKSRNASNEDIKRRIVLKNKLQNIINIFNTKESRSQLLIYVIFALLLLIFANELEVINLGSHKSVLNTAVVSEIDSPIQILDNGTAFVPKNQNVIFVKTDYAKEGLKILVTFNKNYSPASRYWISEIINGSGFVLSLDAPVSSNVDFNWWVSN